MADEQMSISQVLATLHDTTDAEETAVDDVLNAFGRRAYGPILFVVGIISLSPVGSIPGASILTGSLIVVLMTQYLFREHAPWVPEWIRARSVPAKQAKQSVETVKPYLEKMETFVRPRYHQLAAAPWTYIVAIVCITLALSMYPLALVPWGVMPPSLALTLFGLGMMSADGLLIGAGLVVSGASFGFLMWISLGGGVF